MMVSIDPSHGQQTSETSFIDLDVLAIESTGENNEETSSGAQPQHTTLQPLAQRLFAGILYFFRWLAGRCCSGGHSLFGTFYEKMNYYCSYITGFITIAIVIASATALYLIFTLISAQGVTSVQTNTSCEDQIKSFCITEECVHSASQMLFSIDSTVSPCENFYVYACRGLTKKNMNINIQQKNTADLMNELIDLLNKRIAPDDPKPVQQVQQLYSSCVNERQIKNIRTNRVSTLLKLFNMGEEVPLNVTQPFPWVQTIARMQYTMKIDALFRFSVSQNRNNISQYNMVVHPVEPGINVNLLTNTRLSFPVRKKYIRIMVQHYRSAFRMDYPDKSTEYAFLEEFSTDVMTFFVKLYNITKALRSGIPLKSRMFNISELNNLTAISEGENQHKMNWTLFLETVMENTDIKLNFSSDTVAVLDVSFFKRLAVLLSNTSPTILKRYLWWVAFSKIAPLALEDLYFINMNYLFGTYHLDIITRPNYCINIAIQNMGMALSYLYVKSHMNKAIKNQVEEMVEDLQAALEDTINNIEWMDNATKEMAVKKSKEIKTFIGYPNWLLNKTYLEQYYEEVTTTFDDDFIKLYTNLVMVDTTNNLKKLRQSDTHDKWIVSPITTRSKYIPLLNSLTIPAILLRHPFFNLGIKALDYGTLGTSIGHQLIHAIDEKGQNYYINGFNDTWISSETRDIYQELVKCSQMEYEENKLVHAEDFTVDNSLTLAEDIADKGGFLLALRAYDKFLARQNDSKQVLPALQQYTSKQLFYLSFAQMWCSNISWATEVFDDGNYSPNWYRVTTVLSNTPDFLKVWNCPKSSLMNQGSKCNLW